MGKHPGIQRTVLEDDNMKDKKQIIVLVQCAFVAFTFFFVDFSLRFFTRWLGYYSIFELAPSLFSLCWIVIFIVFLSIMPRKLGRIVYAVWYSIWCVYVLIQYVYYLIFNKFFFLSDIQYAGEGGNYLSYVLDVLNRNVFILVVLFLALGLIGFKYFPEFSLIGSKQLRAVLRSGLIVVSCVGVLLIPSLHTENKEAPFLSAHYEYNSFTNSGFDLEIAGLYQYVARDAWKSFSDLMQDPEDQYRQVDAYLTAKQSSDGENAMTDALSGKNLILIQMESLDDWVINQQNAPTISRLMEEGINFTNMYTCIYGSGSTFSTEFAFNTGIYQSTKGVAAYSCSRNSFPYSVANVLRNLGYTANSFHENAASYYNRDNMHTAMGYQKYHSLLDWVDDPALAEYDETLITNDSCWTTMTRNTPFLAFLITYSAHVPYSSESELAQAALSKYPEYASMGLSDEMQYLYAKVRLTDDMFASLLERLEADGLLENTVIIAYADHYCYGIEDKDLVHELTEANGTTILERTPAFIWYKGCESLEVDKVCQTIDWVPTIANLFGQNVAPYVMGNDIFDEEYAGYAIFPDGTWLTSEAYAVNGIVRWNKGMSENEIAAMNSYVQTFYAANEAILASDYYAQFED